MYSLLAFLTISAKRIGRYNESAPFQAKLFLTLLLCINWSSAFVLVFGIQRFTSLVALAGWLSTLIVVNLIFPTQRIHSIVLTDSEFRKARGYLWAWVLATVMFLVLSVTI